MTNSQPDPITGQDINIDIGDVATGETFAVDPAYQTDPLAYVPPVDPRLNEIHAHLHEINAKIDHVTIDCPPKTPAGK